jgi:hypothetical protein
MKGSVLRLLWPALAAKAATRPAKDPAGRPTMTDLDAQAERPIDPSNQITLALLDEYAAPRTKGYDPYNATTAPKDTWQRKRKRD